VLLVIKCLGYGGAERLLVDMVVAGNHQEFDYEVAYILRDENALVPAVIAGGTRIYALGAANNTDIRWVRTLRHVLVKGNFDVVHFHLPYAAAFGQLVVASLPRSRRPGVVYTEHSLWNRTAMPIKSLMRATIGLDQGLVVVSTAARDALPAVLRHRARVVIHGVDLSRSEAVIANREQIRAEVRDELGVGDDELLFLTVANLRPEKGYDVLLDTTRKFVDQGLPIRIAAVGRGPLRTTLHTRHHDLGLGEHFRFLGQRDDVLRLLAGADAFVLASHYEGLPVTLMEATSMGLAIVTTSVGGVPEFFTDDVDALIVPPGDSDALFDAMSRVAADSDTRTRLGHHAKILSSRFDVSAASLEIEDIYRRLRDKA
jgi:glycosyltransferase involved in cell wall biosynthesis